MTCTTCGGTLLYMRPRSAVTVKPTIPHKRKNKTLPRKRKHKVIT